MITFTAIGRKVLVELPSKKEVSDGGILLPNGIKGGKDNILDACAKVISVGEAVTSIKVGDMVLSDPYVEYMSFVHPESKKEYAILQIENVLLTVKK